MKLALKNPENKKKINHPSGVKIFSNIYFYDTFALVCVATRNVNKRCIKNNNCKQEMGISNSY